MEKIEPLTPEWFVARLGRVTGSEVHFVMGAETGYLNYLGDLVTEILTGEAKTFESKYTQWGQEHEADAIQWYSLAHGEVMPGVLVQVGSFLACTPDGLVVDDSQDKFKSGIIEVKCPYRPINHVMCWVRGMPKKHIPQVQFNMWLAGVEWCDFISYHPDVPIAKRLYVQRIYKDLEYIEKMEKKVGKFLEDLEATIKVMTDEQENM